MATESAMVNRPHAPALPAANRRRTGGAQDGATERPLQRPAWGRQGREPGRRGSPPLPPPPAALTHRLPTEPRPTPAAARQPPRHEYTPGRRAGDDGWQADARRGGGAGGGRAAGPTPPPLPPASLRATGSTLRPPLDPRGRPPSPRRDRDAGGGGMWLDLHTARPSAPGRLPRTHTSAPERRADQAWGRRTAAHQNSMGAASPMTPPMTIAHSGRAEGGFRSEGAPGGAVHGPPLIPPPSGAAPRPQPNAHAGGECADDKRGARVGNRGPPPRGGAGRPRRNLPPPPPNRPASRGGAGPTL